MRPCVQSRVETEQALQPLLCLDLSPAHFDATAEPSTEVDCLLRCGCEPSNDGAVLSIALPVAQVRQQMMTAFWEQALVGAQADSSLLGAEAQTVLGIDEHHCILCTVRLASAQPCCTAFD